MRVQQRADSLQHISQTGRQMPTGVEKLWGINKNFTVFLKLLFPTLHWGILEEQEGGGRWEEKGSGKNWRESLLTVKERFKIFIVRFRVWIVAESLFILLFTFPMLNEKERVIASDTKLAKLSWCNISEMATWLLHSLKLIFPEFWKWKPN